MAAVLPSEMYAQRIQQPLGRSVVAVTDGSGQSVLVSWRKLAQEPENCSYNLYMRARGASDYTKVNSEPILKTNYQAATASIPYGSELAVSMVSPDGAEGDKSAPFLFEQQAWGNVFFDIDFETTLRILQARGKYMQEACEAKPSGMISIMGATPEQLAAICEGSGCTVSNINSDSQQVISGTHEAVAKAAELATAQGIKNVVLQVAGAFHSPFMTPARERLADFVKDITFGVPSVPVLSNATGTFHAQVGDAI